MRDKANRVASWTGTVHYANADSLPACGPVKTHPSWLSPTTDPVTCKRCERQFGTDEA